MIHGSHLVALRYGNRSFGAFSRITASFKLGVCGAMIELFMLAIINAYIRVPIPHWLVWGDGYPLLIGISSVNAILAWLTLKRFEL